MKKNSIDDNVRRTMKCMIIGSSVYVLTLLIISTIIYIIYGNVKNTSFEELFTRIIKNIICISIGYLYCLFSIYSMTISTTKAIEANDEKFAKGHMVIASLIRLLCFCIILTIIINENTFGVTGGIFFLLTTMGIKIGAYLTPIIEKRLKS